MRNPPSRGFCSLIGSFASAQVFSTLRRLTAAISPNYASVDPNWSTIPDTKICREALDLTRAISPVFLINHGRRSYSFGRQIAQADKIKYDPELLFLSCIMHDWGLTKSHEGPESFELRGARAAHAHLDSRGYPIEKSAIVYEAIAWHTAVGLATRLGPEQALTHFGTGMDVIGFRREVLPAQFVAEVIREYPRSDFKKAFHELLARECHHNPDTEMARMMKLGFGRRIEKAPFEQ